MKRVPPALGAANDFAPVERETLACANPLGAINYHFVTARQGAPSVQVERYEGSLVLVRVTPVKIPAPKRITLVMIT